MSTTTLMKQEEFVPSIFNDFFKPWNEWYENSGSPLTNKITVPSVNISETVREYKVLIAAPGLKKDDFKIDLEGNMLSISSEKKEQKEEKGEKFSRKEYSFSSFSRRFTLPDGVNRDKIEATYEDGILQLMLPKSDISKNISVKKIAIK